MRIGLTLPLANSAEQIREQVETGVMAEELGLDSFWVSEAYGGDAASVLAAVATRTERISVGSAIFQIPGRTPAMTAMTAAGIDAISRGRFRLGLGVSGPQVSEGWHGVGFADPLGRTSEYVTIVRLALERQRVAASGKHFQLPLTDGLGKSLILALRPERKMIPIYIAAVGPRNMRLSAEISDGWLGIFFDQLMGADLIDTMISQRTACGKDAASFDRVVAVPVGLGRAGEDQLRRYAALYIGGMGAKGANFYHRLACQMGFQAAADTIQERFLHRDYDAAAAAVPHEFLQRTCLLGDDAEIVTGLRRLRDAGITTVNLNPGPLPPDGQREVLTHIIQLATAAGVVDQKHEKV